MSLSCPEQRPPRLSPESLPVRQQGFALVITLILLLVLVAMGVGISHVATIQSDLVAAVVHKPVSIDAGETCFDNALEWMSTSAGKLWVNGAGTPIDLAASGNPLAGKTTLADTVPLGQTESRTAQFQNRMGRALYSSCIVEKISSTTTRGTGYEIGTSNGYGVSSFVYTIRITAIGHFNVALNAGAIDQNYWQSNSSRSTLEAVVEYTP